MKIKCNRCGGTGYTSFKHIEGGVCFACRGRGHLYLKKRSDDLSSFLVNRRHEIDGVPVEMIKKCSKVEGGEFIAKCEGDNVIFWNKNAGANWHFSVPKIETELMKKHFKRI